MSCTAVIKAWVTAQVKHHTVQTAAREMLSESAWLKRLLVAQMRAGQPASATPMATHRAEGARRHTGRRSGVCDRPILVRLQFEGRLLLDARAAARGLRAATYVSVLTRSHLHHLAPLPKDELLTLRRSITELSAIGRNLNQIAKAANDGGRLPATVREEFRAMLKICEALRDNTKALLKSNLDSWSSGHG
jgi:hypothetical protein